MRPLHQIFFVVMTFVLLVASDAQKAAAAKVKEPAIAFAARVVGDDKRARLIVDFNRKVSQDTYTLENPKRIMIDLPETLFSLDGEAKNLPKTLISRMRYGTIETGKSRIVLDLARPVSVKNSSIRAVDNGARHRLIVDMVESSDPEFAKSARKNAEFDKTAKSNVGKSRKFKIVIDPGHGGIDGGATGKGRIREKEVTLGFSLKLQEALQNESLFEVVLTRTTDKFLTLKERLDVAQLHNVDLFMSVHADSLRQKNIRGATIYTLSEEGSDDLARVLAQKQNRADLIAGLELPKEKPNVADILIDLTRRETEVFSIRFARLLVNSMRKDIKLIRNPHRSADFFVLKAPEVPSVLLELGYLSNPTDEKLMASADWQIKAVAATKKAIMSFFAPRIAQQ